MADSFLSSDSAATPVVGIILIVAIAVILAASILVFVLDFTEDVDESAPAVSVEAEFDARDDVDPHWIFTIRHTNGDNIDPGELKIRLVDDTGGRAERVYPNAFTAGTEIRMQLWGSPSRADTSSCILPPETAPGVVNDQLDGWEEPAHASEVTVVAIHEPSNSVMDIVTVDLSEEPDRFTGDKRTYLIDGSKPSFGCDDYEASF